MRTHSPWWARVDYGLYLCPLALALVGWLALYSATGRATELSYESVRQLAYVVVGLGLAVGLTALDYRVLHRFSPAIYLFGLAALAAVMLPGVGHSAKGAQRWVSLGPLGTFQPSEVAKLVLVIALARFLADRAGRRAEPRTGAAAMLQAFAMMGVMFALIAIQPDLGTALVLVAATFVMLWVAGANPIFLAGVAAAGAGALPYVLKEYQRERLLVFLHPDMDPSGSGYNLVQSQTAIGSGSLWGEGLWQGYMSQNGFVPENWTDFIFTVVGEELGFVGCAGIVALFTTLLLLILRDAIRSADLFGTLLCAGIAGVLGFQAMVNMCMTVGLLPVVGIPLPFLSFGGSAAMTNFAAVGIVGSVALRAQRERERMLLD